MARFGSGPEKHIPRFQEMIHLGVPEGIGEQRMNMALNFFFSFSFFGVIYPELHVSFDDVCIRRSLDIFPNQLGHVRLRMI